MLLTINDEEDEKRRERVAGEGNQVGYGISKQHRPIVSRFQSFGDERTETIVPVPASFPVTKRDKAIVSGFSLRVNRYERQRNVIFHGTAVPGGTLTSSTILGASARVLSSLGSSLVARLLRTRDVRRVHLFCYFPKRKEPIGENFQTIFFTEIYVPRPFDLPSASSDCISPPRLLLRLRFITACFLRSFRPKGLAKTLNGPYLKRKSRRLIVFRREQRRTTPSSTPPSVIDSVRGCTANLLLGRIN